MRMTVTFLAILSRLPYQINSIRTCVPNTQYVINNRLCVCNIYGLWNEVGCTVIERRQICQIGQIVREGCNQCVCQQNGQFVCTNVCTTDSLSAYDPKCTPFKSYYINCNLCTCPASGHSAEAHCSTDTSCPTDKNIDFEVVKNNYCIPNVMYIFPCIECVCSDSGFFVLDKCVEKCQTPAKQILRRCIPGTYYRKDCDVCLCPENNNLDEGLCTNCTCKNNTNQPVFLELSNNSLHCKPNTFLKPRCLYCDCNLEGTVNKNRCVEIDCSKALNFQLYTHRNSCNPGEIVPYCMECFCPKNGVTNKNYCTNVCNYQNKLRLLEKIVNESYIEIVDLKNFKKWDDDEFCDPNSVYTEHGRFCLCPESGYKSTKFCTTSKILFAPQTRDTLENMNFNARCEPGTFVEINCNSCYCSVNGTIDPKWCTYDDCAAKEIIKTAHKSNILPITTMNEDGTCTPGSISKVKCNFCICPDSGTLKDRACTKNSCYDDDVDQSVGMDRFTCEPLAYYEVDCNICFCPKDGIKNVAKCTKNHCQKSFLRSDVCTPGHLFTVGCNVCVCPTNGDKTDRVCTEHRCGIEPLNLQKLSQNLLQNMDKSKKIRSLDHCFPGEEFIDGRKICICPEMGLKMYASCETTAYEDAKDNHTTPDNNVLSMTDTENIDTNAVAHNRVKRFELDLCMEYTVKVESERHSCTPGSMYIVRCQQCICPYMGNINRFCRPLPQTTYCEQAFPGFNYLPMGRRRDKTNTTENRDANLNDTVIGPKAHSNETVVLKVEHKHTKHKCYKPGNILDKCFVCNCEDGNVIEEHCFKSDAENCTDAKPSFLSENKVVLG